MQTANSLYMRDEVVGQSDIPLMASHFGPANHKEFVLHVSDLHSMQNVLRVIIAEWDQCFHMTSQGCYQSS